MVLIEMVSCLRALVSVEHSNASVDTHMVMLWGKRAGRPPRCLLCVTLKRSAVGRGSLSWTAACWKC